MIVVVLGVFTSSAPLQRFLIFFSWDMGGGKSEFTVTASASVSTPPD